MRYRRLAAALLVVSSSSACSHYQVMPDPSSGFRSSPQRITQARLTLRSGERVELGFPCLSGDSLRGTAATGGVRRVALSDVTKVEIPRTRAGNTASFVNAIVLANSDMHTHPPTPGACHGI